MKQITGVTTSDCHGRIERASFVAADVNRRRPSLAIPLRVEDVEIARAIVHPRQVNTAVAAGLDYWKEGLAGVVRNIDCTGSPARMIRLLGDTCLEPGS